MKITQPQSKDQRVAGSITALGKSAIVFGLISSSIAGAFTALLCLTSGSGDHLHGGAWAASVVMVLLLYLAQPFVLCASIISGLIAVSIAAWTLWDHQKPCYLPNILASLITILLTLATNGWMLATVIPIQRAMNHSDQRNKAAYSARNDVELCLMYCHSFAQSHSGRYPADLTQLLAWVKSQKIQEPYDLSGLHYYGAAVVEGRQSTIQGMPTSQSKMPVIVVSKQIPSSAELVVGFWNGDGKNFTSNISASEWTTYLDGNNETRREIGMLVIKP